MTFKGPYSSYNVLWFYASDLIIPKRWRKGQCSVCGADDVAQDQQALPELAHQPSALKNSSEFQFKSTQHLKCQTTAAQNRKILLGNDHSPLEPWKTLPQTKRTFPVETKLSNILSADAVSPGGCPESCLIRSLALGSSFPPNVGPNDECRLSPFFWAQLSQKSDLGVISRFVLGLLDC